LIAQLRERLQEAEREAQDNRDRSDKAEEQLEDLHAAISKLTDERDRLQDEVDRLQISAGVTEEQKELENRLHDEIDSLSSVCPGGRERDHKANISGRIAG
jgi:chromosome segregation ATPase